MEKSPAHPVSPTYPGAPRWVKILGVVVAVLALAFVGVHLAGGGFRGHSSMGGTPPGGVHETRKAHQ